MSTTAGTGFCRVTVAAPDARIDVALPEDVPLVDIYPEILRLSGQVQPEGSPTGYHLVRRDGTVLDAGRSLAEQRVLDGDVLLLRPFAESLPPAVFDDVSDAVSSAVKRNRRRWSDELMNAAGLTAGVLLLSMMAFVLWFANPIERDMHGLPGVIAGVTGVTLVALAGVRARIYDDRNSSIALGLASLPHLLLAGSGVFGTESGEGPGRLHFLVGCVVVLIASVLLVALLPYGDSPFVAAAFLAATGTLATFVGILTDVPPSEVAAVTAVVGIALVAWLPGLSARFARLPIGYRSPDQIAQGRDYDDGKRTQDEAVDSLKIAAQARRGHELLLGLVAGCSALVAIAAGVILGFSDNGWAQLLALAAGIAMMLRARLFDYTSQVACLLVGGLVTVLLLLLGITLDPPVEALQALYRDGDSGPLNVHTVWFSSSIALGAAVLVAVGLIVPNKGLSPFWGRVLDIFEGAVLLSLVPLCLAVLDVYAAARAMTS
ncbi:type VII secretion integral membrane protein EccD [Streptomyces alkaliterrae]|uniref:Type VII secretion integral membrane protein EccD n=1 Tax=Streptomyces alkaliterrae TaxID=2213162 RepID=A0A5P0YTH1_9ACTN|nr:type VII secretion integral membrane protein EccD [Streptomyces alkaliterrae]MBB1254333.1 type VII secretion integral membrane protein EccD [Streptomyces alkaliterrae]MBB1260824.1 type VII secretion integral membrane protein EccD [Streptomyces alkaliterrae]MQS02732.1 type VII secretion integral membrane protein EccD [Streptomyces alkaliterrae]